MSGKTYLKYLAYFNVPTIVKEFLFIISITFPSGRLNFLLPLIKSSLKSLICTSSSGNAVPRFFSPIKTSLLSSEIKIAPPLDKNFNEPFICFNLLGRDHLFLRIRITRPFFSKK